MVDKRGQICYHAVMKLSEYARRGRELQDGVALVAGREAGRVSGCQRHHHCARRRRNGQPPPLWQRVAIYARVSAAENRPNLESQAERLIAYCAAKGYQVHQVVQEIGSGVNDSRPKFLKLLADPSITRDRGRAQRPCDALWIPLSRDVA